MGTQDSPVIKIMRLLEPNLDPNCVELIDISDSVESIKKTSSTFVKSQDHFPILKIPSYFNDVLLGESLEMCFILGNNGINKYTDVFVKVEMAMEHEDEVETFTLLESLELDPKCKPIETHFSYLFKSPSRYRMTCSVEYTSLKNPLVLKKMFMWNCINPVELNHSLIKLPDGTNHLETRIRNKSKTLLVLKNVKLENRYSGEVYLSLLEFSKDNICLLRHEDTLSIIFSNININYHTPTPGDSSVSDPLNENSNSPKNDKSDFNDQNKDNFTDKNLNYKLNDFYLIIDWHSYTNISGTNVSRVEVFKDQIDILCKVINIPKEVKINVPFNVELFLQNLTPNPIDVSIKFRGSGKFILQNEKMDKIHLVGSQNVIVSLIPLSSGLHDLKGLEIHFKSSKHKIDNLQILIKN